MNNNLTVIQRNNLYEALVSDLQYAEELMKEFHEELPDEFTFLEIKRLCEWIDGAKDKREVYAILKHSDMKKFEQGDDQYYMYWGTLYHYENDTYHQHVEYQISQLIDLIDYNIDNFKERLVIKEALEDIDKFKLARYKDQIESAQSTIQRAKKQYESIVLKQNMMIKDLQKLIKECEGKDNMKTTLELLNEVEAMGFNREDALRSIDMALDEEFGYENRKDIDKEFLGKELYETILLGFQCELDERKY